jgi:hypothetical protein
LYFYKAVFEGEAYSVAHFSFMCLYLLPDDGRMKGQNVSWKIIINERIAFGCCVGVDWIDSSIIFKKSNVYIFIYYTLSF